MSTMAPSNELGNQGLDTALAFASFPPVMLASVFGRKATGPWPAYLSSGLFLYGAYYFRHNPLLRWSLLIMGVAGFIYVQRMTAKTNTVPMLGTTPQYMDYSTAPGAQ